MGITRSDWTNTFTGMLDAAFRLSAEEQYYVDNILTELFTALRIPQRSTAVSVSVPAAVTLEHASHLYSSQRPAATNPQFARPVYPSTSDSVVLPVSTWSHTLLQMLITSFPDLDAMERLAAQSTFTQLLTGIGVPHRQAMYVPDDVVQMYLRGH